MPARSYRATDRGLGQGHSGQPFGSARCVRSAGRPARKRSLEEKSSVVSGCWVAWGSLLTMLPTGWGLLAIGLGCHGRFSGVKRDLVRNEILLPICDCC